MHKQVAGYVKRVTLASSENDEASARVWTAAADMPQSL